MGILDKESHEHELELRFGTVFTTVAGNPSSRYVILDVGEENIVTASQIIRPNHKEALGLPGTFDIVNIRSTVDVWNKPRILEGLKSYRGGQISPQVEDMVEKYSNQPGRIVTR